MSHLPIAMGPSGSPFVETSASFTYINLNYFPGLAPLPQTLCLIFVHQVYQQCRGFNQDVWTIKEFTVLAHMYVGAGAGAINLA